MMTHLSYKVIAQLQEKTLVTAESCTGGGIGAALTAVPGSSRVFKGGIISYTNWVKENLLGVDANVLEQFGAVSEPVAKMMADGVRKNLSADVAVSITGLAGPDGDEYGNPVGTVYIGYADNSECFARKFHFYGDRESVREQGITAALELVLEQQTLCEKK